MTKKRFNLNIYDSRDYKEVIKNRLNFLRTLRPQLTLKVLAGKIPVQYTYLSKVLNSQSAHLSEDRTFLLGRLLDLLPDEIDFLLLLRAAQITENLSRKEDLTKKIESFALKRKVSANYIESSPHEATQDLYYLLDPICVLIHVAVHIPSIQKNPRQLCSEFGIKVNKLKEVLRLLDSTGYLRIAEDDPFTILEIKSKPIHFSRNHPLMRAHQMILEYLMISRLQETDESQKESFMVTFTADEKAIELVKTEFELLIQKIQNYCAKSKDKNLYQLNFDFLKWL